MTIAALSRDGVRRCYTCAGGAGGLSGTGGWIGRGGSSTGGGSSGSGYIGGFPGGFGLPGRWNRAARGSSSTAISTGLIQDFSLSTATPGSVLKFTPEPVAMVAPRSTRAVGPRPPHGQRQPTDRCSRAVSLSGASIARRGGVPPCRHP
jgi:hypothetical protein